MTKKLGWLGALLLLLAGASVGWCLRTLVVPPAAESESAGDEEGAVEEVDPGDMHVRVTTAPVVSGELPIVVAAAGVVQASPASKRVLSSRAGGRVLETLAATGQAVKRGDVLLRFDPVPLQATLLQARAALTAASSQLSEFEQSGRERQSIELQDAARRSASQTVLLDAQVERLGPLHDDGLVSDKTLAEAKQAAEQARAERQLAERTATSFQSSGAELQHATLVAARAAAEAAEQESERMLAEADVLAPCDGQIVAFAAQPGQRIEPGAAFGELLALEGRVVVFGLTSGIARRLKLGARAAWDDAQGAHHTGTLVLLGGEVDAATGMIDGIVAAEPELPPLPPGLTVRGEVEIGLLRDAVLVPAGAVLRSKDAQVVVLADGDRAKVVRVLLVGRHGGLAAVEGEVHAGDRVVLSGAYNLPDGARIVEEHAEESAPPGEDRK